jgi:uncharacterized membrane-anchored protein
MAVEPDAAVRGRARVGRRTKELTKHLGPGDVAIISHADLDRVAAEGLAARGVAAVVNAERSITGRYPNEGPLRLLAAGITVVDHAGPEVMDIADGAVVELHGGDVFVEGSRVATGTVLDTEAVRSAMQAARANIGDELRRFAVNTLDYVEREAAITFLPLEPPPLRTRFAGRHALVVVRGHDYRDDLAALRPYIREFRPALVGVDGGADALLELGMRPDVIIGDFDSLSDTAMRCGAELVHHVHPDGRAPGREQLVASGADYHEFVVEGTSEDAAMLLAYEAGADLIVAVGTHATMVEFLDKGRPGMASTFLTRLRLGPVLVDAKGVNRLYQSRVRRRDLALLVASALLVIVVMVLVSESLQAFLDGLRLIVEDWWQRVTDAI